MADFPDWQRQTAWILPPSPSDYIAKSGLINIGGATDVIYTWDVANTGTYIIAKLLIRGVLYDDDTVATRTPQVVVHLERGLDAKSIPYDIDGTAYYFNIASSGFLVSPIISLGTGGVPILVIGSDGATANNIGVTLNTDGSSNVFFNGYYTLILWKVG